MSISIYSMAPDYKLIEGTKITFRDCQRALLRLKLIYEANEILDPEEKLSISLSCADEEVSEQILKTTEVNKKFCKNVKEEH